MTNPVAHIAPNHEAWIRKWESNKPPSADLIDRENLIVQHNIKDQSELAKFKEHVARMEEMGKRREMGARNRPW